MTAGAAAADMHIAVMGTRACRRMAGHTRCRWLVMILVAGIALQISSTARQRVAMTLCARDLFVRLVCEAGVSRHCTSRSGRQVEPLRNGVTLIAEFVALVTARAVGGHLLIAVMTRLAIARGPHCDGAMTARTVVARLTLHISVAVV